MERFTKESDDYEANSVCGSTVKRSVCGKFVLRGFENNDY